MTSTTSPSRSPLRAKRPAVADGAFRYLSLTCGLAVLAILALIAVSTTKQAWPAFRHEGFRFLFSKEWNPTHTKAVNGHDVADPRFGALAFIYGTMVISTIALVIAVPVSVGMAMFLSDVAPRRLRGPVSYSIDVLAAIPSVVYGLWGVLVLAPVLNHTYGSIGSATHGIPAVGTLLSGGSGRSFMTAGLILALMITPIITSLTREVFETVPSAQKEAVLALGATRWEMLRGAVLPWGRSGVIGAVMLGLGRAMGETIAAALVIGSSPQITAHLFRAGDALPAVIANEFGDASDLWRAALIGLGVVVFLLTILVNSAARTLVIRGDRRVAA